MIKFCNFAAEAAKIGGTYAWRLISSGALIFAVEMSEQLTK